MSVEYVRHLGTEELCHWLRDNSGLNAVKLEDACKAIVAQNIEGVDFLELSVEKWEKHVGLGTAKSLVLTANRVLGTGAADVDAKRSAPLAVSNKPDIDMGSIDSIHDFLVSHMRDPNKFHCVWMQLFIALLSLVFHGFHSILDTQQIFMFATIHSSSFMMVIPIILV